MKKLLFILSMLGFFQIHAQIKVGKNTKNLNPNSLFEMETDSLGMLLPRVSLSNTTSFSPLKSHVQGMVIYNLATAGTSPNNVTPGFYYNDGAKWVRLASGGAITPSNTTAAQLITVTNGTGATLTDMTLAVDTTALKTFMAANMGKSPIKDSVSSTVTTVIKSGTIVGMDMTSTSGGALTVTGGTGTSLKATSIAINKDSIVTAAQISKVLNVSPAKDSLTTIINNQITGAAITGQNLTSTSGGALTVTGGTGTSLKATSIAINKDSIVTAAQISKVLNTSPAKDSLTTIINNQITSAAITGQNLSAGTLLQTTGTPTGATLKAAGYQVDTTALKTFINGRTTHTMSSATNTITSTVNGIAATAPAVNTVSNTFNTTTRALTTSVNGVAATAVTLTNGIDSTTASNGLTLTGKNVELGGALTKATTVSGLTATNKMSFTGTGLGAFSVDDSTIFVDATNNRLGVGTATPSHKLDVNGVIKGTSLTNDVNSVTSNDLGLYNQKSGLWIRYVTNSGTHAWFNDGSSSNGFSGTTQSMVLNNTGLGIGTNSPTTKLDVNGQVKISGGAPGAGKVLTSDAAGLATWETPAATTHTMSSATNTITSTVNGVAATAPAVNTVSNTFNTTTRALTTSVNGVAATAVTLTNGIDSTTASNGLTLTGKNVALGGALTGATTVTTTAANTLAFAGLQSGATSDSVLVVNPSTGVLARKNATTLVREPWFNTVTGAGATSNSDSIYIMGKVGIGTSTPLTKLDVKGVLQISDTISLPNQTNSGVIIAGAYASPNLGRLFVGDGTGWKFNFSRRLGSITTDLFTFSDQGNLGIGTTTPSTALDVNGQVKISGGAPGAGKVLTSDAVGLATWTTPNAGTVTSVSGTAPIAVATGTTTPVISLNDAGVTTIKIADANVTTAKIADGAVTTAKILDGTIATADIANNAVTVAKLPTGATATTFLRGDGTWVTPTDNNTTYTASNGLTLNATNVELGGALTKATTVSGLTATNKMSFTGTGVDAFNVDGSTLSVDALNNRVGIGILTPNATLSIGSNLNNTKLALYDNGSGFGMYGMGIQSGQYRFHLGGAAIGRFSFLDSAAGNELMTIQTTGDVGIGTTLPAAKLDVNGQVKISGGAPGVGKVLTSNAVGLATWTTPNAGTVTSVSGTAPIAVATGTTTPVISLNDAGVTTIKIADANVTTAKIADANVTTAKIADGAVTTAKILDGTIATADIANNAVTVAKLPTGATATTFLRGDGTWVTPTNTTYTASNGLTLNGTNVELGGALTKATTVSGLSATNKMSFTGTGVGAFSVDDSTIFVDATNNRVGIGTSTPDYSLDVIGSFRAEQNNFFLNSFGDGTNSILSFGNKVNTAPRIRTFQNNNVKWDLNLGDDIGFTFFTAFPTGASRFFIEGATGNVGIGTTSPAAKLDVIGNSKVTATSTNAFYVTDATGNPAVNVDATNKRMAIGMWVPNNALSVNGTTDISGSLAVGTTTPNANAILDLTSTNKGLKLPSVSLSAANLAAPLTAHVAGMLVYNTAIAGTAPNNVVKGIYINDGTQWILLQTPTQNATDVPVGTVFHRASSIVPTGYLACNGQAVSRTTYATLFATIGTAYGAGDGSTTFNVPDLRGEFVRGWDNARGVDAGRVIGSWQNHDFASHTHNYNNSHSPNSNTLGTNTLGGGAAWFAVFASNLSYASTATGGTETRPRNVAMMGIIKF